MRSRYGNRPTGQMKSAVNSTFHGINTYNECNAIGDTLLSDCFEARPSTYNEAVSLGCSDTNQTFTAYMTDTGKVINAISDKTSDNVEHVIVISMDYSTGHNDVIDALVDVSFGNKVSTSISGYGLTYLGTNPVTSMCIYFTEAKRYVCFTTINQKKLLTYDYSTTKLIDLPFYPKAIVSHANRIFATDTTNKIWWCRAGDFTSWYGLEADDDYLVANTDMKNGAYTILAQPDVPRVPTITITKTSTIDTLGTVTFTGTSTLDVSQTEVATPIDGTLVCFKAFKTFASIVGAGWTGVAGTDKIKIGTGAVGSGFVQDDAGYWTLEQERTLQGMAVLGDSLYIWSDESIYVFRGYSPDTFSLDKIVSGIGLDFSPTAMSNITISNGKAFFANSGLLYEFDGESYPRIISKPVITNGAVSNGIQGGIGDYISKVSSDNDYLYVNGESYDTSAIAPKILHQHYYFVFDIKARTWWKRAGVAFELTPVTGFSKIKFVERPNGSGVWTIGEYSNDGSAFIWKVMMNIGNVYDQKTFLVTKSFSSGITDQESLTDIIILCRSYGAPYDIGDTEVINVYYTLDTWRDDTTWTLLKTITAENIPYELTPISIPVIGSAIARAPFYRIKIEYVSHDGYTLDIYGIERRFRVIGRAR